MPDIIFILLFFFMVVTVMREADPKLNISKPIATETEKLEKKSLVDNIYVGPPMNKKDGKGTLIQLDDSFADLSDIEPWITDNIQNRVDAEKLAVTTSLKVDKETTMGIVTDIKQELRDANALKINYSVNKGSVKGN